MLRLSFKMLWHPVLEGIGVLSLVQTSSPPSGGGGRKVWGGSGIQLGIFLDVSVKFQDVSFFLQPGPTGKQVPWI